MPKTNRTFRGIQSAYERRKARVLFSRKAQVGKGWQKEKVADLSKLKAGDIVLTVNKRPINGIVSRAIAKAIKGTYSHVATYTGKDGDKHMIKDFKQGKGGRYRALSDLTKTGVDFLIVRWKKASPAQMEAFLYNIMALKGKYDTWQAAMYHADVVWKKFTGRSLPLKLIEKATHKFTCSESIAEAANPTSDDVISGKLKPVKPPMHFDPNLHKEYITPRDIEAATRAGILEIVTEEKWKYGN
jgi:hypothetical protein